MRRLALTRKTIYKSLTFLGVVIALLLSSVVVQAQAISENRYLARKIYNRITGTNLPVDHATIKLMESYIYDNNVLAAAEIATRDRNFYNITVRDFAAQMSTRDETIKIPLNDFTATVMGVIRDNISAKELLVGNFYYAASPELTVVGADFSRPLEDQLLSNTHYQNLDRLVKGDDNVLRSVDSNLPNNNGVYRKIYPHEVLERVDGQMAVGGDMDRMSIESHPNPAGLLTSRAFMEAHAVMGTNRRIVEFAFRSFACLGIENIADNETPTDMIGRDVAREPGGEFSEFQSSCQACHTQMDSLRPAFARVNFDDGVVKWSKVWTGDRGTWDINDADTDQEFNPDTGVVNKMIRISDSARLKDGNGDPIMTDAGLPGFDIDQSGGSGGSRPTDLAPIPFKLRSNYNANATIFNWREDPALGGRPIAPGTELEGTQVSDFGRWLANSKQFSRCMVQRVFRQVCNREPTSDETALMRDLTDEFEARGHRLKALFQRVATRPECLGE